MNRDSTTGDTGILIAEHMDPQNLTPGGIDSIVHDIVKFENLNADFSIVGITKDQSTPLGKWQKIQFAGRDVSYLPVARLDRSKVHGMRSRIPHSLQFAAGLLRYRSRLREGVYHAHRIETGFVLLLLLRCRLIQFVHNDSNGLLGSASDSTWRKVAGVYRRMEKYVAKRAARMVLFNRADSARLFEQRKDLIVSRTWFDPEVFVNNRPTAPSSESSRNGNVRICWVGRMDVQKDPFLALDVVAEMVRQGCTPYLRMVGDGVLTDALRAQIMDQGLADVVELLGARSRPDVASIMAESDVLLMTSRYEGSPIVLLEAGASGLPVVATEESDPDHALISGLSGERISNRNSAELASAISKCVKYSSRDCAKLAETRSGRVSVPALLRSIEEH